MSLRWEIGGVRGTRSWRLGIIVSGEALGGRARGGRREFAGDRWKGGYRFRGRLDFGGGAQGPIDHMSPRMKEGPDLERHRAQQELSEMMIRRKTLSARGKRSYDR